LHGAGRTFFGHVLSFECKTVNKKYAKCKWNGSACTWYSQNQILFASEKEKSCSTHREVGNILKIVYRKIWRKETSEIRSTIEPR
jgi:hypothetical protein